MTAVVQQPTTFTESVVEKAALTWLEGAGWSVRHGAEIAPGQPAAARDDYGEAVLAPRLHDALVTKLNPGDLRVKDSEPSIRGAI
jgi:type I restriction enzyme R subunit